MKAGALGERLTIQAQGQTGKPPFMTRGWTDEATVWGEIRTLTGREVMEAARVTAKTSYRGWVRYRASLDTTRRILWSGKTLQITHVAQDPRKRFTEFLAEETA